MRCARGNMATLCLILIAVSGVVGESFDMRKKWDEPDARSGMRSFVAPDPGLDFDLNMGESTLDEKPELAEFNYHDNRAHLWLVNGLREDIVMWNFQQGSAVSRGMKDACERCTLAGNMECVRHMCRVTADIVAANVNSHRDQNQKAAFITGTAMHSDILCSLCKHTNDVMCTLRLCIEPERDQNARESGIQCMSGFCRWEKEAVATTGFNNNYLAWWQPQSLVYFFNHVSQEIYSAYGDFLTGTAKAVNGLG